MAEFDASGRWQQQAEGDTPGWAAPESSQLAKERESGDARARLARWATVPNLAFELDDSELGTIGARVKDEWKIDEESRSEWRKKVEDALKLAMQISKPKNYPWPGSSSVIFPLMTTAAMQFAARAYPAIVANRSVVKGVVRGRDDGTPAVDPQSGQPAVDPATGGPLWLVQPGALQSRADRIGEHMSWQLLEEMPEWEPETDKLLHQIPIVGTVFRKSYFDPSKGRNLSLMVPALKLVVNYWAKSLELAPRVTEEVEYYPYEIREMERAGLWLEHRYIASASSTGDEGENQPDPSDEDAPIVFLEQHRWWDLDGDGYPEPYVVTVDREGAQVVRIVARFETAGVSYTAEGEVLRIDPTQYYTQYDFLPSLDGGIYGTGFGQLLGPINASVNTTLNMLLDAGHLANTNGGFIAKDLSLQAGTLRWTMGEFKPVNARGMALRDAIMPLPFSGPSQVLFALLGTLIDAGKDVASIKDVLAGEQPQANVPATTTLALIEQGQKVFTAIYKRLHRALKAELEKLYRLNRVYMPVQKDFRVGDTWKSVTQADYAAGAAVEPVSDPQMVSDMQQLGRAQFLMQFKNDPLVNQIELMKRLLKAASIEEIAKLLVQNPSPPPQVAMKGMELEIKGREVAVKEALGRTQSLQFLAQAILNLAKADQAVGDQHLGWLDKQLQAAELAFSMTQGSPNDGSGTVGSGSSGSSAQAAPGVGPGLGVAGVPALASPPGVQGLSTLHPGLPQGTPAGFATRVAGQLSAADGRPGA